MALLGIRPERPKLNLVDGNDGAFHQRLHAIELKLARKRQPKRLRYEMRLFPVRRFFFFFLVKAILHFRFALYIFIKTFISGRLFMFSARYSRLKSGYSLVGTVCENQRRFLMLLFFFFFFHDPRRIPVQHCSKNVLLVWRIGLQYDKVQSITFPLDLFRRLTTGVISFFCTTQALQRFK